MFTAKDLLKEFPSNLRLWRYLDLGKFLTFATSRTLWLARIDQLGHSQEGAMSLPSLRYDWRAVQDWAAQQGAVGQHLLDHLPEWSEPPDLAGPVLGAMYASCWFLNEHDSELMWSRYADKDGVALVSTVERVAKLFMDDPYARLSPVRYIDYANDLMGSPNDPYSPCFHRPLSVSDEREFRVVRWDIEPVARRAVAELGRNSFGPGELVGPIGVEVPIDPTALLLEIRVSPLAPRHVAEAVQSIARMRGLGVTVSYTPPAWPSPPKT